MIDAYLSERAAVIFKPIFDYLAEADSPRTLSEIDQYFSKKIPQDAFFSWVNLFWAFEWLARKELITKVSSPMRLTKSPVTVEEPAFYYERDEFDWA